MQMYRVKFARKLTDATVDLGEALVCAQDRAASVAMVAQILALPVRDTTFEVNRVKPSFYQISRRDLRHSVSTFDARTVDEMVLSTATFPGVTENRPEEFWFSLEASADIRAEDENEAIKKLSIAIAKEINGDKQKPSVKQLDIRCDRPEVNPRNAAVDQNALYSVTQIFSGGAARGK